jgi:hypothetical protein
MSGFSTSRVVMASSKAVKKLSSRWPLLPKSCGALRDTERMSTVELFSSPLTRTTASSRHPGKVTIWALI